MKEYTIYQPFKTKSLFEKKHKVYQLQLTNVDNEHLSYDVVNYNIGDFNINYPTVLSSENILDLVWHACNVKEWNDNYKINEVPANQNEMIYLKDISFHPTVYFTGIANSDIYVVIDMDKYKDIYVAKSFGWVKVNSEGDAISYILHNYPGIKWVYIRNKDDFRNIYNSIECTDLKSDDYVLYK